MTGSSGMSAFTGAPPGASRRPVSQRCFRAAFASPTGQPGTAPDWGPAAAARASTTAQAARPNSSSRRPRSSRCGRGPRCRSKCRWRTSCRRSSQSCTDRRRQRTRFGSALRDRVGGGRGQKCRAGHDGVGSDQQSGRGDPTTPGGRGVLVDGHGCLVSRLCRYPCGPRGHRYERPAAAARGRGATKRTRVDAGLITVATIALPVNLSGARWIQP